MKAKLVAGLVAIALGGFTSCGNILEENGVINNVAQNGTGELRINLATDANLNVSTKSGETEDLSSLYASLMPNFLVTLTAPSGTSIPEGTTLPNGDKFSDIENIKYKLPASATYTLSAKYTSMKDADFAWDSPEFDGTNSNVTVTANKEEKATVTCKLTNSIIDVQTSSLTSSNVTINSLYVTTESSDATESKRFMLVGTGVASGMNLSSNKVYVKTGVTPYLVLSGSLAQEGGSAVTFTTKPTSILTGGASATEAQKKYVVNYSLSNTNGQLSIKISIDGNVTTVPVNLTVDPYQ